MKTILLIALFGTYGIANGQAPDWLWSKSALGTTDDGSTSVYIDANGNVFLTGYFDSPSITFGATTLTNVDNTGIRHDIFVVKYDPSGNVLWAKSAGAVGNDYPNDIACDANGNVLVSGTFQASSITFGTTTLTNAGNDDVFVVKYDGSGNILWAKSAGGAGWDSGNSISTDANGNAFVAGYFDSPSITFGTTTLTNASNSGDIFLMKYDASGNVLWAKSAGGTNLDGVYDISSDKNGNVFLTGYFWSSSITFGSTTLTNTSSSADIFVSKYDSSGNILWAKSAGGYFNDFIFGASTDASGNVLATGYFEGSTITFGSTTLTNTGSGYDIFIVKYDASGNLLWAKSEGGTGYDRGISISANTIGNVFLTGFFQSDSITFGSSTLTNSGINSSDIFIVKYDTSGNVLWAKSQGGTGNDQAATISTNTSGNVFVTGYFQSPFIIFSATTLTNTGSSGTQDIFLAKLDNSTGISEELNNLSFSVFPNPFAVQTTLQTDMYFKNASLTVYNSIGQTVKRLDNVSGQTITFNRDNLPSGLYCVQLTQDGKTFSADKFVIVDE